MEGATLTARRLYRLLNAGSGNTSRPIPLLKKSLRITQTDFWWCFLSAGMDEKTLLPYFYTGDGRPRALSNMMNRTVTHSIPGRLYHTMEERLEPEKLWFRRGRRRHSGLSRRRNGRRRSGSVRPCGLVHALWRARGRCCCGQLRRVERLRKTI